MLSAYFLRKIHSIMTNCKFVIGRKRRISYAPASVFESLHYVYDDKMKADFYFDTAPFF